MTELLLSRKVSKPLVECEACGSYYFSPRPTGPEIATCYVGDYRRDFFRTQAKNRARGAALARTYARSPAGRFLDVGCSIGSMMEGFQAASGWEVAGTEFDGECVSYCRSKRLNVTQGLLYDSVGLPAPFDVILANNVLEHEPDPEKFLTFARGLLSESGVLVFTVPNGRVDAYPSIHLRHLGNERVTTNNEGHINFFSRRGIEALLRKTGFRIEGFEPFHMKMALKKRFLLPRSERKNRRTCIDRLEQPPLPSIDLATVERQVTDKTSTAGLALSEALSHLLRVFPIPVALANDFRIHCRKNATATH